MTPGTSDHFFLLQVGKTGQKYKNKNKFRFYATCLAFGTVSV